MWKAIIYSLLMFASTPMLDVAGQGNVTSKRELTEEDNNGHMDFPGRGFPFSVRLKVEGDGRWSDPIIEPSPGHVVLSSAELIRKDPKSPVIEQVFRFAINKDGNTKITIPYLGGKDGKDVQKTFRLSVASD